jgi:riboflavin synthase
MFTGLIEDIGTLVERTVGAVDARVAFQTHLPLDEVRLGDSIAVQGACLTVTALRSTQFTADASAETLRRTTLGHLKIGSSVHLERALTLQKRLDGHIVQGHVDGTGRVVSSRAVGRAVELRVQVPPPLLPEVAEKGSIAVDGVSLTVNGLENDQMVLVLVPHTLQGTLLGRLRSGDSVNLETDVLAKYVRRMMPFLSQQTDAPDGRLATLLHKYGYDAAPSKGLRSRES